MAVIDPRLLPLIEALAASGADWLAFELFDGLHVGQVPVDSDDDLNRTRLAVREFRNDERLPEEPDSQKPTATPIVGDEQIEWAAKYVADRISDSIRMLESSLDHLESIVTKDRDSGATFDGMPLHSRGGIALRMEGEEVVVRRTQIDEGIAGLPALEEALLNWAKSVRSGGHTS
jgi:hypothetical protein